MTWSARPPLEIHAFEPLRTYLPPFRTAVVRSAAASEPEPGSVSAHAPSFLPAAMSGRERSFCSLEPKYFSVEPQSEPCTEMLVRRLLQPFASSSVRMAYE